jgi:hypothetical protein
MQLGQAPPVHPAAPDALEHRLFQLETLYEIGRECARVERLDEALRIVLSMVMGAFGSLDGRIHVQDATGRVIAGHERGAPLEETAVPITDAAFTTPFEIDDTHPGRATAYPVWRSEDSSRSASCAIPGVSCPRRLS